jgi:hypothetical protein
VERGVEGLGRQMPKEALLPSPACNTPGIRLTFALAFHEHKHHLLISIHDTYHPHA